MAKRETPAEQIERLLQTGDPMGALRVADELLGRLPDSPAARLGRCRALLQMGRTADAEIDLDVALRAAPKDEWANFLRGSLDIRAGRVDDGLRRLRPLAEGRGRHAVESTFAMLDILFHANRRAEWRELLATQGAWRSDVRASHHLARAVGVDDPAAGAEALRLILVGSGPPALRRAAGFEAAGLLDRAGEYRRAFDLAREAHARTGDDFNLDYHLKPMLEQAARIETGIRWIEPVVEPVSDVALLVSLPRSGTTLLEQMLDRHPGITGIGEYEGVNVISRMLGALPAWPRQPGSVPAATYAEAQRSYLQGARRARKEGSTFSFDKGLRTWRALPEVAAVLPGAVAIAVHRDPRDLATSLFLSHFRTEQIGWTLNMQTIRRVIEVERRLVPRGMEVLGLRHRLVLYESLVQDPAREAKACLDLLGLPMDERVLSPEQNERAATTLSAMQVRRPINRGSIGRWKNYEFAFDASWDALVADHEAALARDRAGGAP